MKVLLSLFGSLHSALYRASGGRVGGSMKQAPILLLTTKGRKTGKMRTTPLIYGRDGDNIVVLASVGGADCNPDWFYNLKGQKAEVQIGREKWRVKARVADGGERDRLWAQMVEIWPDYAEYQKKTTRQIPVMVLEQI
jgi:deazaflavin-dependent oxidoreductase (nitroreductase family)